MESRRDIAKPTLLNGGAYCGFITVQSIASWDMEIMNAMVSKHTLHAGQDMQKNQ